MDLRQLKYFHAVVNAGSLSAASATLNLSQPAIGMQIRSLEEALELKLLTRHSRGVRPTPAGQALYEHADRVLHELENARRALNRFRVEGTGAVRIGVTHSLAKFLVPRLMALCNEKHNSVSMLFLEGKVAEIDREWEAGNSDFTFTDHELDTCDSETIPLFLEEFSLVGRADLMRALPDPVPLEVLVTLPLVYDRRNPASWQKVELALVERGLELQDGIEIQSMFLRRVFVMQQQKITLTPTAIYADELADGTCAVSRIDLPTLVRCIHLAGPRVERMSKAEAVVRAGVIEVVDQAIAEGELGWRMPASANEA